jgi:hypothetical protein
MGSKRRERGTVATVDEPVVICTPTTPPQDESRWYIYGKVIGHTVAQAITLSTRFKQRASVMASVYAVRAVNYLTTRLGTRSSLSAIDNSARKSMTVPLKSSQEFLGTPTTRVFPRSMADAFPNSVDRAEWFYPPERNTSWTNVVMLLVGVILWVGLAYFLAKD